jgi:hypothetical protein
MTQPATGRPAPRRVPHRPVRPLTAPARATAALLSLAARVRQPLAGDGGYSTETVIVTALLAAAALAVIGIIVAKVTGLANSINM